MKKIISIIFVLLISACVTMTTGKPINQNAVNQIKRGITTKDQVLSLMGEPEQITEQNDHTIFVYQHMNTEAVPGSAEVKYQTVAITFDGKNKVVDISNTRGTTHSNMNNQ